MRNLKYIIVHCSDSPTGRRISVQDIDNWHILRGFRRQAEARAKFNPDLVAIGYHFLINADGTITTGRSVEEVGAHCQGLNANSIGICLEGRGEYTQEEMDGLKDLIDRLLLTYGRLKVLGHYETDSGKEQGKTCPMFDVAELRAEKGYS